MVGYSLGACLCAWGVLSPAVYAEDALQVEAYLGISLMDFGYKEFSDRNVLFNREDGFIPGTNVGFALANETWRVSLERSQYSDRVDYEGQTFRAGIPLTTNTDEVITDNVLILTYQFSEPQTIWRAIYVGFGQHKWERDIQPTELPGGLRVAGLLEDYKWGYGLIGARLGLAKFDQFGRNGNSLQLDVRLTRTVDPELKVDFQGFGGYDKVNLKLQEQSGIRIGLAWTQPLKKRWLLSIEPFFEAWNLGRSDAKEITIDGNPTGISVLEPESETRNYGININFRFSS